MTRYVDEISKTKAAFNAELEITLGEIKKMERLGYPSVIYENAGYYWAMRCPPNPNRRKKHVIFSGRRGFKRYVPQQIQFATSKQIYEDWLLYVVRFAGDDLKTDSAGNKILPSYQWFTSRRPPWIKKANKDDFSTCAEHTNMDWMIDALTNIARQPSLHLCGTSKCPNYKSQMGKKCTCDHCEMCCLKLFLRGTHTKRINEVCCDNDEYNYPKSECWKSKQTGILASELCKEPLCGGIADIFDGLTCRGLTIPGDHLVTYFRLHSYRMTKTGSKQQWTEQVSKSWVKFSKNFVKSYKDFISHHIESVSNNRTRHEWFDKRYSLMKEGDASCHMDWSHNVDVESKVKTSTQWGNRLGVALAVALCFTVAPRQSSETEEKRFDNGSEDDLKSPPVSHTEVLDDESESDEDLYASADRDAVRQHLKNTQGAFRFYEANDNTKKNKLKEWTVFGLNRDPIHDCGASLRFVEETIISIVKRANTEGWTLRNYYGYSDQSSGEFHSSAFLYGLRILRKKYNLSKIEWTFTCPHHGKGKYDGEGHVFKWVLRLGVHNGAVIYNLSEGFEVTMMNYMRDQFKSYKCDREIVNMTNKPAKHLRSKDIIETWSGLCAYSQYRDTVLGFQRRYLDCKCAADMVICACDDKEVCDCDSAECVNEAVVGKWSEPWEVVLTKEGPGDLWKEGDPLYWYDDHCRYNYMSKSQTVAFLRENASEYQRNKVSDMSIEVDPIVIQRAKRKRKKKVDRVSASRSQIRSDSAPLPFFDSDYDIETDGNTTDGESE